MAVNLSARQLRDDRARRHASGARCPARAPGLGRCASSSPRACSWTTRPHAPRSCSRAARARRRALHRRLRHRLLVARVPASASGRRREDRPVLRRRPRRRRLAGRDPRRRDRRDGEGARRHDRRRGRRDRGPGRAARTSSAARPRRATSSRARSRPTRSPPWPSASAWSAAASTSSATARPRESRTDRAWSRPAHVVRDGPERSRRRRREPAHDRAVARHVQWVDAATSAVHPVPVERRTASSMPRPSMSSS